jgi:CubicO group peptidase (beta-lactamase class C family)
VSGGPGPRGLDARVEAAMAAHVVPGVAIGAVDVEGIWTFGYGITNVDHPLPVDGDTVFEIASITKTMTATVAARLASEGKLDLDALVRTYLPDFRVADPTVSATVTVRDLFTHTAGWFGEYLAPTGHGPDAIARGVASMTELEQVSPKGLFSYNNVSLIVAGRVVEVASGQPYREAVENLLFLPLDMERSTFDPTAVLYERLAAGHTVRDGRPVRVHGRFRESDAGDPVGGALSTASDLLDYARFHMGDGTVQGGIRLMPAAALAAMQVPRVSMGSVGHVGLSWFVDDRGGKAIVTHGGATIAHMSQLVLVPSLRTAFVILTNGANGARLCAELSDWLLTDWLGLPARPAPAPLAHQPDLAPYAGRYFAPLSDIELVPEDGALVLRLTWKGSVAERPTPPPVRLTFTAVDAVVALDGTPPPTADFIRGADGDVAYFRWGSRVRRKVG